MAAGWLVEAGTTRALSGAGASSSTFGDVMNASLSRGEDHKRGSAFTLRTTTRSHRLATNANRLQSFRRRARRRRGDGLLGNGASDLRPDDTT